MAAIQTYRTLALGVAGGAVVGGVLAGISQNATPDNTLLKNVQHFPMLMMWNAADQFSTIAMSSNPAAYGRRALIPAAVIGAGAVVGVNALFNTVTTYNTIDPGLNELESSEFRGSHLPRAFAYPLAGVAAGAALTAIPSLIARRAIPTPQLIKTAAMGGLLGGGGAMWQTAWGQTRAYKPSTDEVGAVADTLFTGIAGEGSSVAVDTALSADTVHVKAGQRDSSDAVSSRFYALADAAGTADGALTRDELRAHVATFDTNADGHVSVDGSEWKHLHDAVVEGVKD